MTKKTPLIDIWRAASVTGILLSVVSTAYFLFDNKLTSCEGNWVLYVRFVLDFLKIYLCIYILYRFLQRFALEHPGCPRADITNAGRMTSFLSALIYATAVMAFFTWHPGIVHNAIHTYITSLGSQLNSDQLTLLEDAEPDFPKYAFVAELVYCYLAGRIITAFSVWRINKNFNDTIDEQ